MHAPLILIGVFIVLLIVIHIVFKLVKFTFSVFIFGLALIAVIYVFQNYFGIDLVAVISSRL